VFPVVLVFYLQLLNVADERTRQHAEGKNANAVNYYCGSLFLG
jgi:hypothetical protein